jgi:hypothetical protein
MIQGRLFRLVTQINFLTCFSRLLENPSTYQDFPRPCILNKNQREKELRNWNQI